MFIIASFLVLLGWIWPWLWLRCYFVHWKEVYRVALSHVQWMPLCAITMAPFCPHGFTVGCSVGLVPCSIVSMCAQDICFFLCAFKFILWKKKFRIKVVWEASCVVIGLVCCKLPCGSDLGYGLDVSLCTGMECDKAELLLVLYNGCFCVQFTSLTIAMTSCPQGFTVGCSCVLVPCWISSPHYGTTNTDHGPSTPSAAIVCTNF